MDDTTRLVSELETKLAKLDSQVAAYRQDMAAEFQRYSDALLREVPDDVSDSVCRAIARSRPRFPSLYPNAEASDPPRAAGEDDEGERWSGRKSPPPVLHHTSGPKDGPRSPHEREKEFRGVFTPNYLPLLDGGETAVQSPPSSSPAASPFGEGRVTEGTQTTDALGDFRRPPPSRRLTDSSSVDSSGSEAKTRRSALRRSSSASNRASPRRVRFEVQGEEVSPTASPQASNVTLGRLGGDDPPRGLAGDSVPAGSKLRAEFGDEQDPPPARKVSSSERLRALSKLPLEDPAKWRLVSPQSDLDDSATGADEGAGSVTKPPAAGPPDQTTGQRPAQSQTAPGEKAAAPGPEILGSPLQDLEQHEDDDSSEDDYISMRSLKKSPVSPSSRSSVSPSTPTLPTMEPLEHAAAESPTQPAGEAGAMGQGRGDKPEAVNGHSGSALRSGGDSADEDDADSDYGEAVDDREEVFEFDEDARSPRRENRSPRPAKIRSYRSSGDPANDDATPTSPGVGIPMPRASPPVQPSAGSYRGRQITTFDVVKDFRLHEKAAELGDFSSFVGSVDGRTGADAGDVNSFRTSLNNIQYSGTPRSLSERLAMDEARERMERERSQ